MNNKYIAILVVVALLLIGAIYFNNTKKVVNDSEFRNAFIGGCVGDATFTQCDCAYTEIKKNVGLEGLLDMGITYDKTGTLPKEVYSYIIPCFAK